MLVHSYLDMDVGGGEGEYVSLDVEAWDYFLDCRFKRLSVTLDPVVAQSKTDPAPEPEEKETEKDGAAKAEGGEGLTESRGHESEGEGGDETEISPGLEKQKEEVGVAGGGEPTQSTLESETDVRVENEDRAAAGEGASEGASAAGDVSVDSNAEKSEVPGLVSSETQEGVGISTDGVSEAGDGGGSVRGGAEDRDFRSSTEALPDGVVDHVGEVKCQGTHGGHTRKISYCFHVCLKLG